MNNTNTYSKLPDIFYHKNTPRIPSKPNTIAYNSKLAKNLSLSLSDEEVLNIFSGTVIPSSFSALSMNYCGHQFGHFNPHLGDGRAHLLTEVYDRDNNLHDIQLKGSGQSKYSRRGDGLSPLGPVLREYLLSESMHRLGIPTTRALCAISSGDPVYRDEKKPGAIFTRVSRSLLRVGHFEYYSARGDNENLKTLVDYTIDRLYPDLKNLKDSYFQFFKTVAYRKIDLVSKWLGVGFIHGVMNTDNTSVFGLTIDYGPCAFMDDFQSDKVFSSIDRNGRYAYDQQLDIAIWNICVFGQALIPLLKEEALVEDEQLIVKSLKVFIEELKRYSENKYLEVFSQKFGLSRVDRSFEKILKLFLNDMEESSLDFTNTFFDMREFKYPNKKLQQKWMDYLAEKNISLAEAQTLMSKVNPYLIPRNHQVEKAITEAEQGSFEHFEFLLKSYEDLFTENHDLQHLTHAPQPFEKVEETFCGT